jgi:hypothetical protein
MQKNNGGVQPLTGGFLSGYQARSIFTNLPEWTLKLSIPQNVVATHRPNILHIENFSAIPFDLKPVSSARRGCPSVAA